MLGAGATVVDVSDDDLSFHLLHARDPRAGTEVYVFDPATGADAIEH